MAQTRKKKILEDVKKARRRRTLASTLVVAVLAVIVITALILAKPSSSIDLSLVGTPISTKLMSELTGISNSTLATVGSGGTTPLTLESWSPLTSGKPEVLYIGAEFCPYCAAERWSMVVALSRFGTFSGLTYMISSSTDKPSNIYTISFRDATYRSSYISFVSVETKDRDGSPLQNPTSQEQSVMNQFDSQQNIPFLDIGNASGTHYVTLNGGSQYLPDPLLTGMNWTQIGLQLDNPNTAVARAIDGAANYLITEICKVDGGNPANVCTQTFAGLIQAPFASGNTLPSNTYDTIITSDARSKDSSWRSYLQPTW